MIGNRERRGAEVNGMQLIAKVIAKLLKEDGFGAVELCSDTVTIGKGDFAYFKVKVTLEKEVE